MRRYTSVRRYETVVDVVVLVVVDVVLSVPYTSVRRYETDKQTNTHEPHTTTTTTSTASLLYGSISRRRRRRRHRHRRCLVCTVMKYDGTKQTNKQTHIYCYSTLR